MIVSDEDSENFVFDDYNEASKYFEKEYLGYAIVNFKINGEKYYMVTFE